MSQIVENIRLDLKANSREELRESGKRFFREPVNMYGMKTTDVTRISKKHLSKLNQPSKSEIFSFCEEMWQSGMIEESFIACGWAYSQRKNFTSNDFPVFERWVNHYVSNWASCDTLCNHTIGTFVEMYPSYLADLKRWAHSENRWVKRASAVTLIIPAKEGLFIEDIFEIANILLHDSDDMVQKGYGWMLKAASKPYPDQVFEYINRHKATMPRTALRYAIEKLPVEMKKVAMEK
ncbi:MAG TPA: DNA alkylation repair protein [Prolixibacteraceae bacterium]|nr:DNA alkylation repair protein [Prolixibacteraceae bacterium]